MNEIIKKELILDTIKYAIVSGREIQIEFGKNKNSNTLRGVITDRNETAEVTIWLESAYTEDIEEDIEDIEEEFEDTEEEDSEAEETDEE